jgi:hypothetical protein
VTKVSGRIAEVVAQGTPCELLSPSRVNVDIGPVNVWPQGRRFLLKGEIIRLRRRIHSVDEYTSKWR